MKTEIESKDLLARYGIATTRPRLATSAAMAEEFIAALGGPCAMKVVSADIVHKLAAGGVKLSVMPAEATEAYDALISACLASHPDAQIEGVLVEEMVPTGLEVFIGARVDPQYDAVILLGRGGSNVEKGEKPVAALAPLTPEQAGKLIDAAFPDAFEGEGNSARQTLKNYILAVGGANGLILREKIGELDINPIIVNGAGAVAVDAVAHEFAPEACDKRWEAGFEAAVERRRQRLQGLGALFEPEAIAVVGASTRPEKLGYRLIRNLIDFGFSGDIYPIHPSADEICGLKAYPSIEAIPGKVDRAYIAVTNKQVPQILASCRDKGVKVAQVLTAGFSEYSSDSNSLEEAMAREIAAGDMRMVGPNCIGTFSASGRLPLTAPRFNPTEPGDVTFFSQSGTFACDVVRRADVWGVPVGRTLSCGNCADLDLVDYLLWADQNPATKIIAFYIESLTDPGLFFRIAERVKKPIVILRGGATDEGLTAASSHTAALATDRILWNAGLEQAGVLQVDSVDDLMDALLVLSAHGSLSGRRLGIFGSGGGVSVTSSDAAARTGLEIASLAEKTKEGLKRFGIPGTSVSNPIDIPVWGLKERERYILEEIVNLLKDDAGIDSIIVYIETGSIMDFVDSDEEGLKQLEEICASLLRAKPGGPPVSLALRSSGDRVQDDFLREQRKRLLKSGIAVFAATARAVCAQAKLLQATQGRTT